MGGSRALAAILGFLATLLIARSLEPAAMGLWSMALALQGLALQLGEAGLRSVAVTELAREPALAKPILRRIVCLRLLTSTSIIVLGSIVVRALGIGDPWLTCLLLTSLWPIALQLDWVPLAEGRNRLTAALLLVRPVAFLGLLLLGPVTLAPTTLAGCFLAAWWLAAIASWPCLLSVHRRLAITGTPPDLCSLLRSALPVAAATLASQLLTGLDILLVGACLGPADAAFYHLASAVLVAGLVVANGLGQAALARMAARATLPAAFREALAADLKLVLGVAGTVAATALLVAPVLLPLAFGAAYAPAVDLLVWLLPWFVLQHATTVLLAAMIAARLTAQLLWASGWMVATLLAALAVAWLVGDLRAFAVARGLAELVRLAVLWQLLGRAHQPLGHPPLALHGHR
jgi:O-antigen/teichoic acid export membrane protein